MASPLPPDCRPETLDRLSCRDDLVNAQRDLEALVGSAGPLLAISSVGFMAILALPARLGELVRPGLLRKRGISAPSFRVPASAQAPGPR